METSLPGVAPGLRARWVVEGVLAVSPMPRPEDAEALSGFPTVLSLAGPAEYMYSGGLDPRTEASLVSNFVWLPVGEYNAAPLVKLARALEEAAEPRPVLVHCFRGCGRSSMAAAGWLAWLQGVPASTSLSEVSSRTGCGVETLPQRSVVEALSILRRALGGPGSLRGFDGDDPRPEYAALIASRLAGPAGRDPVGLAAEALEERRGPVWEAAELAARLASYTIAGFELSSGRPPALRVHLWIPRGAHPAAVPEPRVPVEELRRGLVERLSQLVEGVGVEVVHHPRGEPPWV